VPPGIGAGNWQPLNEKMMDSVQVPFCPGRQFKDAATIVNASAVNDAIKIPLGIDSQSGAGGIACAGLKVAMTFSAARATAH